VLTFIALWISKETRGTSLDAIQDKSVTVAVETTSP
jgi:hypothetical protein